MNEEAQEALERYRQIKNGMSAIKILMEELELMAWNQYMDALDEGEKEHQEEEYSRTPRCYF